MDDEKKLLNFLRMEKWLADRPHHPGEAAKQWLKDLYQDNQLVKGEFGLGGRTVDLRKITMPVLNIFAKDDHIIPPKTHAGAGRLVGTKDYTRDRLPGGHVGVFVSGKSQGILGQGHLRMAGSAGLTPARCETPRLKRGSACWARRLPRLGRTRSGARRTRSAAVVCVHGLTRNARDFDFLAAARWPNGHARGRARSSRARPQRVAGLGRALRPTAPTSRRWPPSSRAPASRRSTGSAPRSAATSAWRWRRCRTTRSAASC